MELGESASDEFCREGFKSLWVYFCSDVENRQKASVDSAMNDPRCGNFRKAYKEIAEKLFCGSDAGYTGKQAYEDALTKLQELAQPAKKEKPLFSFSTPKEAPSAAAFEKKAKGMIEAAKTQSATPQKR